MRRYQVQAAFLFHATPTNWFTVRRCWTEQGLRRAWWKKVNSESIAGDLYESGLLLYRMYDTKEDKVVEP